MCDENGSCGYLSFVIEKMKKKMLIEIEPVFNFPLGENDRQRPTDNGP